MSSSTIEEDFDVFVDRSSSAHSSRPQVSVHQLTFERTEEALDDGIVVALAAAAHAALHPGRPQLALVRKARVLAAAIGVMQHAALRSSIAKRHRQRTVDELGAHVRLHRPADDAARPEIHHDREVEPAFVRAHVGDVGRPDLIALTDIEASVELIVGDREIMRGFRRPSETLRKHRFEALCTHQALDALATEAVATSFHLFEDTWAAADPTTLTEDHADLSCQSNVIDSALARRTLPPGVEATWRHS